MDDLLGHWIHYLGLYVIHQGWHYVICELYKEKQRSHAVVESVKLLVILSYIRLKIILVIINRNDGRMLLGLNLIRLETRGSLKLLLLRVDLRCDLRWT